MNTETGTVKVYELAKELGMDSISLLERLQAHQIQVKNHMSELRREELRRVLPFLKKKEAATEGGVAVTKGGSKKAPTKGGVRKRPVSSEGAGGSPFGSSISEKKASSPPIVRRRVTKESSPLEAEHALERGDQATLPSDPSNQGETEKIFSEEKEITRGVESLSPTREFQEGSFERLDPLLKEGGSVIVEKIDLVSQGPESASQSEEAVSVDQLGVTGEAVPAPKKKAPIVLPPRPVAPKRSFLKIVEATPLPQRPIVKPADQPNLGVSQSASLKNTSSVSQDPVGFRIIKMTKENLDQMVEEEAAKKRAGGLREAEIRPEDVRFADYRKKELVFLPKKKKLPIGKEVKKTKITVSKAQKRVVEFAGSLTVSELANQLSVKGAELIRKLMQMGEMVTLNHSLDFDTAVLLAQEYQYEVRNTSFDEKKILGKTAEDPAEELKPRPPIVTIMGHVDHGKTTLLDALRETNVVAQEAGGITQHIGAYTVEKNGRQITFIDTPGHEAFTVMRSRGARVTDLVILVVSADDGVMPQTKEALSHAQAAQVPVIVAINKMDKPGANPDRIKQALSELGLVSEEWGGDTQFVAISALKRTHLDKLLDAILLQAEMLDLKANPQAAQASGNVLEARLDKGRGPVVSLLVRRGTLRLGDAWVAGTFSGRVRALFDAKGQPLERVEPGFAAEALGLEGVPQSGEMFQTLASESEARTVAEHRLEQERHQGQAGVPRVSLDDFFAKVQAGQLKELPLILKADTFGSVEAIRESLEKLSTPKVKVKLLLAAVGGVTESDVLLARASHAVILGFHVRPETKARQMAEAEGIEIQSHTIIYELLDQVKAAMVGLLEKKKIEKFLGRAEVRQVFQVPKFGTIAGCSVVDGKILRGAQVRLLRESRILYQGSLSSLKRFKDDVKEVGLGVECGIGIAQYHDLKPKDLIEAYEVELVTPELS